MCVCVGVCVFYVECLQKYTGNSATEAANVSARRLAGCGFDNHPCLKVFHHSFCFLTFGDHLAHLA